MRGWESSELPVAEDYLKAIRAKLSHIVDETFYSIPIDGANCCYLNSLIPGAST